MSDRGASEVGEGQAGPSAEIGEGFVFCDACLPEAQAACESCWAALRASEAALAEKEHERAVARNLAEMATALVELQAQKLATMTKERDEARARIESVKAECDAAKEHAGALVVRLGASRAEATKAERERCAGIVRAIRPVCPTHGEECMSPYQREIVEALAAIRAPRPPEPRRDKFGREVQRGDPFGSPCVGHEPGDVCEVCAAIWPPSSPPPPSEEPSIQCRYCGRPEPAHPEDRPPNWECAASGKDCEFGPYGPPVPSPEPPREEPR